MSDALRGHCAVIINPNGDVVAEATDFDGPTAAGFSRDGEQVRRVKDKAYRQFAKHHLNDWLGSKVDGTFADRFFAHAENCGYKLHVFPIGDTHE